MPPADHPDHTAALAAIRSKYAPEIARLATQLNRVAKQLDRTNRKIEREACNVAGNNYTDRFDPAGFDGPTLYEQNHDGISATDPAFTDIIFTASTVAREATRVADAAAAARAAAAAAAPAEAVLPPQP